MPSFRWSAINGGGDTVNGVMEAPDRGAVVERLQRQGHLVLRADPADRRRGLRELLQVEFGGARGLDKAALSEVTRELAIMLRQGRTSTAPCGLSWIIPAHPCPWHPRKHSRQGAWRQLAGRGACRRAAKLLQAVCRSCSRRRGGRYLAGYPRPSRHLARTRAQPQRQPPIGPDLSGLAGSRSGRLDRALLDYVLPQFTPIFEQAGAELPASTRVLMALGAVVGAGAPWLLVGVLAAALIARQLLARPANRLKFDRLLLRLPIAGSLLRETLAARLTRTLGSLLQNGVPLIPALGIAQDALGNSAASAAVEAAAIGAKGGAGFARPLAATGLFPDRTIHLLQLGEEAAQLSSMALKAADIHDEQARLMMQRLVALAVPLITITMGLAVAGIVSALLTAMLSLNDLAV